MQTPKQSVLFLMGGLYIKNSNTCLFGTLESTKIDQTSKYHKLQEAIIVVHRIDTNVEITS